MTARRAREALRPLTPEEAKLLRWVLEHGSEDLLSYLPQLKGMRCVRSCDCGCSSIRLEPLESAPRGSHRGERIIGDFLGITVRGDSIGVVVFQEEGRLAELEVYPFGDFESKSPDSNFPSIESLEPN
jgi:hypothetical protein